jgi:hypothetical protein
MNDDDLDYGETLAAKSNQLNADDLAGGPITVQITGARVRLSDEQPLSFRLSGGHCPWNPCKGMRRLLAEIAGSTSARPWVGKWIRLYRDPDVLWGGKPSGGIRVEAVDADLLPRPGSFNVRISRNGYTSYDVEPIRDRQQAGRPTADLAALLAEHDLTPADLDLWRTSEGKAPIATLSDDQRAQLAGWLAGDPERLVAVRAASTTPPTTDDA